MTIPGSENSAGALYDSFTNALAIEIEQLNLSKKEITLFSGTFLRSVKSYYYYRFEIPENLFLLNIRSIRCTVGSKDPLTIEAGIVALENQFLTLSFNYDLGLTIPELQCTWDPAGYRNALLEIIPQSRERLPFFAVDDTGNTSTSPVSMPVLPEIQDHHRNALQKILSNTVSLLWGPVHTGKTFIATIAALQAAREGKRVLFLCSQGESIDGAVLEIVSLQNSIPGDRKIIPLRLGLPTPAYIDVLSSLILEFQISEIISDKSSNLGTESELNSSYFFGRLKESMYEEHNRRLTDLNSRLEEKARQIDQLAGELRILQTNIETIQNA